MADIANKSWGTVAVQLCLVLVVLVISIAGNGTVTALLVRFKKLRTIPNILIANMAVIDLVNTIINIPIFIFHNMLKVPSFLGPKTNAFVIGFLYAIFYQLNIYSMDLLALDRYGAIVHGMKYTLWKTRKKAYVAVGLVWILAFLCTVASYIPFARINIQNGTTDDYRRAQFETVGRITVVLQVPLTILVIGIMSVLTLRGMSRANKLVPGLEDMPERLRQTRQQTEVKAAKTMLMTFVVYVLSYLPSVAFAILVNSGLEVDETWHGFLASYGLFISSGCNPIIYAARNKRLRHAFKQFWKDPCGKVPFQEAKEGRIALASALPARSASIHAHSQVPPGSSKETMAFSITQKKKMQGASNTLQVETTKRHASLPTHLFSTKTSPID